MLTETFSCNYTTSANQTPAAKKLEDQELQDTVQETLRSANDIDSEVYSKINEILFEKEQRSTERSSQNGEINTEKAKDLKNNFLFNKFHHLFEYDATYYSYLIAKVTS